MKMHEVAGYVFYLGVLVALVATFMPNVIPSVGLLLLVLGLATGLMNITEKETSRFLIASVALLLTSKVGWEALETVGPIVQTFLGHVAVLVAPAALIVALKAIWSMAKE